MKQCFWKKVPDFSHDFEGQKTIDNHKIVIAATSQSRRLLFYELFKTIKPLR